MANSLIPKNFGIASAKVMINNKSAPNIDPHPILCGYDISAFHWEILCNSPHAKPLLAEQVVSEEEGFAVIHPSKRITYIDNTFATSTNTANTATAKKSIQWSLLSAVPEGTSKRVKTNNNYSDYTLIQPGDVIPNGYTGPNWAISPQIGISEPNDRAATDSWWTESGYTKPALPAANTSITVSTTQWLNQQTKGDGLWWAIQSSPFGVTNVPFWIFIRTLLPPPSYQNDTCFVIRIGDAASGTGAAAAGTSKTGIFDLYLSLNKKPLLLDWTNVDSTKVGSKPITKEWNDELSKLLLFKNDLAEISIGVMTIGGRLIIYINNIPLVYTMVYNTPDKKGGTLQPCILGSGPVKIFGTNAKAFINMSFMTFAELSAVALPIPRIPSSSGSTSSSTPIYRGLNNLGQLSGSVCQVPQQADQKIGLYGCDCNKFIDKNNTSTTPTATLDGMNHLQGSITLGTPSANVMEGLAPSNSFDYYMLFMKPDDVTLTMGENTIVVKNGGCPYFFRLKGYYGKTLKANSGGDNVDITSNLMSLSVTESADDYFHYSRKATLTFYNENNVIGQQVSSNQVAIGIYLSWLPAASSGSSLVTNQVFTGLVISVSKNETAGKETITLNCEDYMYILSEVPIMNSPMYDGMVVYYAIRDLAYRAGIVSITKDWDNEVDDFLPAGYSFTAPVMKFKAEQTLLECMLCMVKRFEATIYFDERGIFHVKKLPGGLLSNAASSGSTPTAKFTTDITKVSDNNYNIILTDRNVDIDFGSTVNNIFIMTLTRDTREYVISNVTAPDAQNKILFSKPFFKREAALGGAAEADSWRDKLALRMFYQIRSTKFKTVKDPGIVQALDFVTLDDSMFRVMSITREYNAEENDLTVSYECEWLGGA